MVHNVWSSNPLGSDPFSSLTKNQYIQCCSGEATTYLSLFQFDFHLSAGPALHRHLDKI